jgi:quinol monooxygenase YgiN
MFGLVVLFTLRAGHETAFDDLVTRTLASIKAREPGTLIYAVHQVVGEPQARIFYELYADAAAFEAHERQPHVRAFLDERVEHTTDVRVERLDLLDAKGSPAVPQLDLASWLAVGAGEVIPPRPG